MSVSMMQQANRPPYVRFEDREQPSIDEEASKAAGRPIPRVIDFACITPLGSKDCVEKPALEWLKDIKAKALRGEYQLEWVNFFQASYDEWKKGNELPRYGTPIKTWQLSTKEFSNRAIALGITTVEDLGEMPDGSLANIGLDGRHWRDLARAWVNEAKDKGVNAQALANAHTEMENMKARMNQLEEQNRELRALVEAQGSKPHRGKAAA